MKISAVVITLNEEKNIKDCLESLGWADELVVVDMESDDHTAQIARHYTKNVFSHKRVGYVEPARNYAIKKATGDWILIIDADERIPKELAVALTEIVNEDKYNFVRLPRMNIIFGQWMQHSRWWPDYNVRFFRRGKVTWQNEIHSIPITEGAGFNLEAIEKLAIIHNNYDSIESYLIKLARYTGIQAKQLEESGYKFYWVDLIKKPVGEFYSRYFAGEGYDDGLHGLVIAGLQAFSEFIVYLKVWEIQGFRKEHGVGFKKDVSNAIKEEGKSFQYWLMTMILSTQNSRLAKFILKAKRKLKMLW